MAFNSIFLFQESVKQLFQKNVLYYFYLSKTMIASIRIIASSASRLVQAIVMSERYLSTFSLLPTSIPNRDRTC